MSGFPFNKSSRGHRNPLSLGTNELIYCAVSTSIPSGNSSLLYPRHAVKIVERVPSVPKVAIKVQPKFFLLKSSISLLKFCPRSSFIFLNIKEKDKRKIIRKQRYHMHKFKKRIKEE